MTMFRLFKFDRVALSLLSLVTLGYFTGTAFASVPSSTGDGSEVDVAITETFARDVIGNGWELTSLRGDKPEVAEWVGEGGEQGGVIKLVEGELRSPLIPVAITQKQTTSKGQPLLEPGIYRVNVRVRAQGTPERRHTAYANKGPHHGVVHIRFYDGSGRAAPGSWFSQAFGEGDWQEISFDAMAPQWARQVRVAVIAHPGCTLEIDTLRFSLDEDAIAAFDRDEPVILYRPEPDRWEYLPRTMAALREGRPWRVVVLGDSIANDLYRSDFNRLVNAMYPGAAMQLVPSVHGSAGWDFFLKTGDEGNEDRIKALVLDHDPDLVVIAGMSNREVADLRELAGRIRKGGDAEILAVTAAVCQAHYRDTMSPPPEGEHYPVTSRSPLRAAMAQAGHDDGFAVFDMGRIWDAFLWNETRPLEWYTRDTSHLNPRGMAVIGRIMGGFFQPLTDTDPSAPVTLVQPDLSGARPPATGARDDGEIAPQRDEAAAMPVVAEVVGRIVRVSPLLTLEQIAPYADAFRAVEYLVKRAPQGDVKEDARIVVIQQILKDRKPTAAARFAPNALHRLTLGLWEDYPNHETWPVSDDLDAFDAQLYYAQEVVPVTDPTSPVLWR
jgi:hypothetical protein